MATTVSNLGRGNYVLGGLGAVRGPSAADAMVENQQEARAAREAELLAQQRRQQMQLAQSQEARAQSQEARAQATFAQQQEAYRRQLAAAAEARNREAQRRALLAQYSAPGVGEAPVFFQPQAAPAAAPVVQPPVNTTGYPVGVPVTRTGATPDVESPAGVRTGALRRRNRVESSVIEGGAGADALGGGAGADALPTEQPVRVKYNGFLFDVYPASGRVLNPSGGEYPDTPGYADLRAALFQLAGGVPAVPPGLPAAPVPGVVRAAGTSGAVPSTVPTSSGGVISLDALVPSYRPAFEQGLAAGPDPVHTTEGGDDYFVYSDGRVFDVGNALSGGDPFDVPANVQDRLRARVGVTAAPAAPAAQPAGLTIPPYTLRPAVPPAGITPPPYTTQRAAPVQGPPAGAGARTYTDFVAAARTGQPLSEQEFIRSVEAGMLTPQQAADVQAMLDGYVPSEQEVRAATAPGRGPMPDTGYIPPAGYQALENFIQGVTGETLAEKQAREAEYAARAGEDYTQRVPTTPDGRRTTVEVDEGPVLTFGGGLRTAESDSPIDFILGQPVGSGAVAPIPRELPRLNAAIQQGVTERQRLVDAYNAFYQAGFTEDANAYLTAIQNLDQTLIRLQGEQALNDLSIGYPERASMVLSHYLGANAQLVLNQEDAYDLYVNGQPVENEDLLDMAPQDAADLVRRYYDSGYQESMQEIRNTYLTEKAKRQAEQDVKDEAALQALESAGFEVVGKETIAELGDGWRSRDPRTGKEYFAYIVDIGEDGIPQTRVIEVPTGARIGG